MASTIFRLMSFIILILALAAFGSCLRAIREPERYHEMSGLKLKVHCVCKEPKSVEQTVLAITITRHGQDKPLASITVNHYLPQMAPHSKNNMEAEGNIDNVFRQSSLSLTISRPEVHDAGSYTCLLFGLDYHHNIIQETATTFFDVDDVHINALLTEIQTDIPQLITGIGKAKSDERKIIDTLEHQQQDIRNYGNGFKDDCLINGWKYYHGDGTCLKIFGSKLNWTDAKDACQSYAGNLVQIETEDKNHFVYDMFYESYSHPWIGINNHAKLGFDFKYVNGSDIGAFQAWEVGWPKGSEDDDRKCVCMSVKGRFYSTKLKGRWQDSHCSWKTSYVCSRGPF